MIQNVSNLYIINIGYYTNTLTFNERFSIVAGPGLSNFNTF